MGGDSNFGGNGSVVWDVSHVTDDSARKQRPIGQASGSPGPDQATIASQVLGKDGIPSDQIGVSKGHRGFFVVTLRYPTIQAAQDALTAARITTSSNTASSGSYCTLQLLVPAITTRTNRADDPPLEVKVEW